MLSGGFSQVTDVESFMHFFTIKAINYSYQNVILLLMGFQNFCHSDTSINISFDATEKCETRIFSKSSQFR